ncbi:MAG: DUF4942 domain-containing protein [Oscillospiraceae bacterium]
MTDFIQAIVNRYKVEIESGIELIRTYTRMLPYLRSSVDPDDKYRYDKPIIALTDGNSHDMTINSYVKKVRLKYWQGLLTNHKFIGRLTTKLQQKYRERVSSYADYDFSEFNIYTLLSEMNAQIKSGIENEILVMYDRLTEEHAYYPECKKNRHLYDGWKTNKAWKLGKKSIMYFFANYGGNPDPCENTRDTIEIMNQLDLNFDDIASQLELYRACMFANGINWNRLQRAFEAEEAEIDAFCEKIKENAETLTDEDWNVIRLIAEDFTGVFWLKDVVRGKNIYSYPVGDDAAKKACRRLMAWHDRNEEENGQSD